MVIIYEILLYIDGIIYGFIDGVYDIFDFLARINLFGEDKYNDIVGRIYIVLGVLMLFVLAYTLLRAIINPDEFSKGDSSFANLAKNIVVSLIIIVMLPTVFAVAFNIQDAILNTGTITNLILGNTDMKYVEVYSDDTFEMFPGRMLAINSFASFFYPNPEFCKDELNLPEDASLDREQIEKCKDRIHSETLIFFKSSKTLREVDSEVKAGTISMRNYAKFGKAVKNDEITYSALISTAAGIFLLYVLLNFVFDLALRVIKLMFYQIIAPIPVICRIIPFGGFKDVFKNWLKQVTGVFFEVFVRIGIMNFGILLIKLTFEAFNDNYRNGVLEIGRTSYGLSWLQFTLARILIVMGIVMFIRKAPELLSKLFGIDTGGMKLGLREKLAQGGAFTASAALGAAGGMAIKNGAKGIGNIRQQYKHAREDGKGRLSSAWAAKGAAVRGLGSTIAGTVSGGFGAGYRARNAKNGQDVVKSTSSAIETATRNKKTRDNYRAKHLSNKTGLAGAVGTMLNVAGGHIKDKYEDVALWIDGGLNKFEDIEKFIKDYTEQIDEADAAKDKIYERNSNNSLIQKAFMKQLYDKAEENYNNIGISYDANKKYKDAYGKDVINVTDEASFRAYKKKFEMDKDALQARIKTALDKTAMVKYIQGKQDEGYKGSAEPTLEELYLSASEAHKNLGKSLDASGAVVYDPTMEYKDTFGNVVTINNDAEFHSYVQELGRDLNELTNLRNNHATDATQFIQSKVAAGKNIQKKSYMLEDLYGVEHSITDEGSYYSYLSLLEKQMGDIDRGTKKLIANTAAEDTPESKAKLSALGLDTNATDINLTDKISANSKTAVNIANEKLSIAKSINKGQPLDLGSFTKLSDFKDLVKEEATRIYAEKTKLQREKAERDAAKKG